MGKCGHVLFLLSLGLFVAGCNQTPQARLTDSGDAQTRISQWRSQSAGMDSRSQAAYLADRVSGMLPNQRLNGCADGPVSVPRSY